MTSHTAEIIELTTKFEELVHELNEDLEVLRPDCDVSESARERNSFATTQWQLRNKTRTHAMQLLLVARALRGMVQPPGVTGDPMEVILMRAETLAANALRLVEFKHLDEPHNLFDLPEPEKSIVIEALSDFCAQDDPHMKTLSHKIRERAHEWLTYLSNKKSVR
jgi:hypothetical protein